MPLKEAEIIKLKQSLQESEIKVKRLQDLAYNKIDNAQENQPDKNSVYIKKIESTKCAYGNCDNPNLAKIEPCGNLICNTHLLHFIQNRTKGYVITHQDEKSLQVKCGFLNCNSIHTLDQQQIKWACGNEFAYYYRFANLRQQYVYSYEQYKMCSGGNCNKNSTEYFRRGCQCQDEICTDCAVEIMILIKKCSNPICPQPLNQDQIDCLACLQKAKQLILKKTQDLENQRRSCSFSKKPYNQETVKLSCSHYACVNELANFIIQQIQKNCVSEQDLSCQTCKKAFSNELIKKYTDSQSYQKVLYFRQNNQQIKISNEVPQNYIQQGQVPQQNQQYVQAPFQQRRYSTFQIQPSTQMMQTQGQLMCKACQQRPAVIQGQGIPLCSICKNNKCERCGQQIHAGNCNKPLM